MALGTVVFADAKHVGGLAVPRSRNARRKRRELERRVEHGGLAIEGNLTSAPSSTVNAGAEKASNPGTRGLVPVASGASSVTSSRGFTARRAMMPGTCVSTASRVPLVSGRGGRYGLLETGSSPARSQRAPPGVTRKSKRRHGSGAGPAPTGRRSRPRRRGSRPTERSSRTRPTTHWRRPPVDAGEIDPALRSPNERIERADGRGPDRCQPRSGCRPAIGGWHPRRSACRRTLRGSSVRTHSRDVHPVVSSASSRGRMERRTALGPCKS
jgi:hypothetical protein